MTAIVPTPSVTGPANNGGGSSSGSPATPNNPANSVTLSGFAFPNAKLTLLKDGQIATTLIANREGSFAIAVNGLNFGNYQFAIYAEDRDGVLSASHVVNVPVFGVQGYSYAGIVIPPTIQANASAVSGYAAPNATIIIEIPGIMVLGTALTDADGFYQYQIPANLAAGTYQIRARAQLDGRQSMFSKPLSITQYSGSQPPGTVPPDYVGCVDYNKDRRVNLVDFSILLYWFNKPNPPRDIDCDADNSIDLKDFSILMYFWTG